MSKQPLNNPMPRSDVIAIVVTWAILLAIITLALVLAA